MPLAQPQLAERFLGPDHPLHLDNAEEAGLPSTLQLPNRIAQRAVTVDMTDFDPLFTAPLFDGEKSVCHNSRCSRGLTINRRHIRRNIIRQRVRVNLVESRVHRGRDF